MSWILFWLSENQYKRADHIQKLVLQWSLFQYHIWYGGEFLGPAGRTFCLYTVWISISSHLEKKKTIAAQLLLDFFDIASKICRSNCSSLANRSMDSSLGGKKERWGKICWGLFNPSQFKIKTKSYLMTVNLFHPLKQILTVAVRAPLVMLWSDSCSTFLTVCQILLIL